MAYTHLNPGVELEVSERIYSFRGRANVPDLVTLPMVDIVRLERESTEKEQAIYDKLLDVVKEWKEQAGQTVDLRQAKQYLLTPTTSHTANQWQAKEYDWHELSNMVYKFTWRVYERTAWNRKAGKSVTEAWELSWYLTFNTPQEPDFTGPGRQIAGQERKVFKDPADMEKYLQGRIKAHSHLFTEISPPIPEEHKRRFCVNGVLLPGYTVEDPNALKPDEAVLDDLLSLLDDAEIGGEAPAPPSVPQLEEKSPQAIWEKHRKQRTGNSQKKASPVR